MKHGSGAMRFLFAAALVAPALRAQEAASRPARELVAFPASVSLDDERDRQRLSVLARSSSGSDEDRSIEVAWRVESPDLAEIVRDGTEVVVRGLRSGEGELLGRVGDQSVRVPLRVRLPQTPRGVSYAHEVQPILTRAGCNAGSCHGAAAGKNGFGLSLFGFDPARDHRTLTHELRARRIDLANPEQSLLLQKATANVPHKGNRRFGVESDAYGLLRDWIAAGAPNDLGMAKALQAIEVFPREAVLVGRGRRVPLQVRATFADGSDRDVTAWTLWSSSNDSVAAVDAHGVVSTLDAGAATILARHGGQAVVTRVRVLADDAPFAWPEVPEKGPIDRALHAEQRAARVVPAGLCSDETFVRRVFLDLLGILPTVAETRAFLADASPDKREKLVDDLLTRPEFASAQAMAWAEVLQVDATTMEQKGATLFMRWLEDAFRTRMPFDRLAREILLAQGSTYESGPVNFYLTSNQPILIAEKVAQNFLGVRMQCAQCHNHPFEKWTMDDYYGFAAFFAQVGRKRGEDPYEQIVWDTRAGEVRNRRTETIAPARVLGGPVAKLDAASDRRAVLAEWLLAKDNPYFAANVVNRIWARLMGRGIVDPPDDVRVSNAASHPGVLAGLAERFVAGGYDVRLVVREICASRAYQRAQHDGGVDPALFAGHLVRRLPAESLLDAIGQVTGVPSKYPGVPLGKPATSIATGNAGVRFLAIFGRPVRESACTCDRRTEPTLSQTLHMIHGETIATRLADPAGRLRKALGAKRAPEQVLEDLFLAAYARFPREAERQRLLAQIATAKDALAAWQDLAWAVLNSKEFVFQH